MSAGELALAEHDELHRGVRGDGRVARRLVEQRQVAEEVAGPSLATFCPWRVTLAVPSMITKNSAPVAPSLTSTLPARP